MWNNLINQGINAIVVYGNDALMPMMCLAFAVGVALRWLIYFTVKCEYTFALEFEKRVFKHLTDRDNWDGQIPFHRLTKEILERTFHEHFELKRKYKRRRFDHLTSVTDRLFLIEAGALRLVRDTLSQTKYLRKGGRDPKFLDIAKYVFNANPVFNRLLGVVPMATFHDVIGLLPGLFVVGGIFGTFLGIMQALPGLSHIDVTNVEVTKKIMDTFLLNMAYSMGTSILGIVLSVALSILNTVLSPEGMYINMVNKFTSSLEFLWNECETNDLSDADLEDLADRRADPRASQKHEKRRVVGERPAFGSDAKIDQAANASFSQVPTPRRPPESAAVTPPVANASPAPAKTVDSVPDSAPKRKQLEIKLKIVEKALESLDSRRSELSDEQFGQEKARLERERERIRGDLSKRAA